MSEKSRLGSNCDISYRVITFAGPSPITSLYVDERFGGLPVPNLFTFARTFPLSLASYMPAAIAFSEGITEGIQWIVDEAKKRARPRVDT